MHDIAPFLAAYRIDEPQPGVWRVVRREGRVIADGLALPQATRLVCDLAARDRERLYAARSAPQMAGREMQAGV